MLPPLPSLRVLRINYLADLKRLEALQVPRLMWIALAGCFLLNSLAFDCPALGWVGIADALAPVHVESRCACPFMGPGEVIVTASK